MIFVSWNVVIINFTVYKGSRVQLRILLLVNPIFSIRHILTVPRALVHDIKNIKFTFMDDHFCVIFL